MFSKPKVLVVRADSMGKADGEDVYISGLSGDSDVDELVQLLMKLQPQRFVPLRTMPHWRGCQAWQLAARLRWDKTAPSSAFDSSGDKEAT